MLNLGKFLNKKFIFIFIIILLLIAGGVFCWQENRETPIEKWEAAKVSPEEDYVVKETPEEKIVANKKMGLSYKIPKDWLIKKDNLASFHSPDAEFSEIRSDVLIKGCQIEVLVSIIKTNLATLEEYMNEDFQKWSSVIAVDEFQRIKIDNYSALKYKYHVKQDRPDRIKMSYISIDTPSEKYLYKILLAAPLQETERCEEEFGQFLETVSIE